MSAIEHIKAAYDRLGLRKLRAPEAWGLEIYAKPFTVGQYHKAQALAGGDNDLIAVYTVLIAACDKDGSPLFDTTMKADLMAYASVGEILDLAEQIVTPPKERDPKA